MKIGKTLYVHKTKDWRAWLKRNHARTKAVWLVYYKKESGKPRVSYNDAVDEALCFGWIDSTVKTLDTERFCQRFSPRRKGSPCSELNKHRAIRLIKEKRMTPAGLAALEGTLGGGARIHKGAIRHDGPLKVPAGIARALKKAGAWGRFLRFPEPYRRIRVSWVAAARRRPAIFKRRLDYLVKRTAKGERFGMLQG